MIGYIYKITNTQNGKVYIGKTTRTIAIRWGQHLKKAKQRVNNYLYDAMNHYGCDNFSIETIETCSQENLNGREKYWINFYNAQEIGYNRTCGGDGGNTWELNQNKEVTSKRLSESIKNSEAHKQAVNSTEYKQKISKINKGKKFPQEFRDKLSEATKRRFQNPLEREKLSKAHRGKKLTDEHKRNIGLAVSKRQVKPETRKKMSDARCAYWARVKEVK